MKGLKEGTREIQDTLTQCMTGGSVRLEAETVIHLLCETTKEEKQKTPPLLLSSFQFLL